MILRSLVLAGWLVSMAGAQDAKSAAAAAALKTTQEQEIDVLIRKGEAYTTGKDPANAIAILEQAWQKVQKNPAIHEKEAEVLMRLAKAYIDGQRPGDAVRAYQFLLQDIADNCRPGSAFLDRCADAKYGLGTAQMYKGDFEGAVGVLRQAVALYARIVQGSMAENYRMNKVKQQGDATALLAAAMFRTGHKPEAMVAFQQAINMFDAVDKSAQAAPDLKASARNSRKDAETSLDLLRKN